MVKRHSLQFRLLLFIADLIALTIAVDCFAPKYPQTFRRADVQDDKVYAVAAHEATQQFFMGGSAFDSTKNVLGPKIGAFAMGIDTVTGKTKWRKFIERNSDKDEYFESAYGMAVSLDGTALAVHLQTLTTEFYNRYSIFASMRTSDGGILFNAFELRHGIFSYHAHAAYSNSMVYKDASTLYVTFLQTSFAR